MVATTTARYFSGDLTAQLVSPPPRQSSLRSVSSTHSRRSQVKSNPVVSSTSQRRVRFAYTKELDLSDRDYADNDVGTIQTTVHEFASVEPVEALYLTGGEIHQIRSGARRQAVQFAEDHPDYVEEINELLENIDSSSDIGVQLETLRRRHLRRNTHKISTKWLDLDPEEIEDEVYCEDEEEKEDIPAQFCDDDVVDSDYYCPMRGLETRITPLFRIRRRWAIHSVLEMQQDMKEAGCCATQVEMGLRAVCVQVSQKSRSFALHQALLDELEATASP